MIKTVDRRRPKLPLAPRSFCKARQPVQPTNATGLSAQTAQPCEPYQKCGWRALDTRRRLSEEPLSSLSFVATHGGCSTQRGQRWLRYSRGSLGDFFASGSIGPPHRCGTCQLMTAISASFSSLPTVFDRLRTILLRPQYTNQELCCRFDARLLHNICTLPGSRITIINFPHFCGLMGNIARHRQSAQYACF